MRQSTLNNIQQGFYFQTFRGNIITLCLHDSPSESINVDSCMCLLYFHHWNSLIFDKSMMTDYRYSVAVEVWLVELYLNEWMWLWAMRESGLDTDHWVWVISDREMVSWSQLTWHQWSSHSVTSCSPVTMIHYITNTVSPSVTHLWTHLVLVMIISHQTMFISRLFMHHQSDHSFNNFSILKKISEQRTDKSTHMVTSCGGVETLGTLGWWCDQG